MIPQRPPASMDARDQETLRRLRVGQDMQSLSATATIQLFWVFTVLLVDTTSATVTLTLPPAQECKGYTVNVKKMAAANTLTLDGNGSELIDGAATLSVTALYAARTLVCDGTQWLVL